MNKLEKRIRKYVADWQVRLRLLDWRIQVVVEPAERATDEEGARYYGITHLSPQFHSAVIRIATPENEAEDAELESTVVHELLHLHFMPYEFGSDPVRDTLMEASVDTLASCLMQLAHPGWKDPRQNI